MALRVTSVRRRRRLRSGLRSEYAPGMRRGCRRRWGRQASERPRGSVDTSRVLSAGGYFAPISV